ncbi:MAG: polysaccharide pyruvyl transferase family protein [Pseudomonadota bacterium]
MKVGMVTIHRVPNYGSILQTYALQRSIINIGYDCEVIDYLYPNNYHQKPKPPNSEKSSLYSKLKLIIADMITGRRRREEAFAEFLTNYIILSNDQYKTMSSLHECKPEYDIYITGSDQVWNTKYMLADPTFLLEFAPESAKRIAYAASFGNDSFDQHYAELYKKHLRKYSNLSVRERSGTHIIADLIGRSSEEVLDPTLLLTSDEWRRLAIQPRLKKKYILCYFLEYSFNPQPYAEILAMNLKKNTGYELVILLPYTIKKILNSKIHAIFNAGPREFLGWFANAEIVLTTSFHGSVFAISFEKTFVSLVSEKPTSDCRQRNLLEGLQMPNQILPINSELPELSRIQPDYDVVNKRLNDMRKKSLQYLTNALNA